MAEKLRHQQTVIGKYLNTPGNKLCADCKRPSPTWASINLGVFVCIKCSGCHREIGTHVTKIKSINLDLWPPGVLGHFGKMNNEIANNYWEYHLKDFNFETIRNNDFRLQDFIRDKYERKRYINSKKVDPMTLVLQGHDLIKEYALKQANGEVEEEEEERPKERNIERPKKGRSFGIVSKPEDKDKKIGKPQENNFQNSSTVNIVPQADSNIIQNNNSNQSSFSFIKKKPTDKTNNKTDNKSVNNNNVHKPFFLTPKTEKKTEQIFPKEDIDLFSVPANNDTLIDLYNIESQPNEAVKKLNEQLTQVYNSKEDNVTQNYQNGFGNTIPNNNYNILNMNYPNININNFYSSPFNNPQNNQANLLNPNGMNYGYQNMGQTQPYQTPPLMAPIFNIELYDDPKKKTQNPYGMNPPTSFKMDYNSNINNNQSRKEDPFKNLVSFK